ncbi:MAG TPA: ABC transporter substrate-binding protein [Gaiellaceae bacterium]
MVGAAAIAAWLAVPALFATRHDPFAGMTHSAVAAQYKPPPTLRVNTQFVLDSVDPAYALGQPTWQLEYATCAKLMNYPDGPWAPNQPPVPEVAAGAPTISADGKTYIFKLLTSFRFSNASKELVTAETFKHALERELAPGVDSFAGFYTHDVVGADEYHAGQASSISGITIGKKKELIIQLERPAADFPARLATPFFCAVPLNATPAFPNAVVASAGPYYVESFNRDGTTVLRRNPNYGGKRPRFFDAIVYQAHVPAATTEAEIKAGNVDYAADGLPNEHYAAINADFGPGSPAAQAGHQQFFVNPALRTQYVALNVSRPLFANVQLRKAVNYALDRPAMADVAGAFGLSTTDQILPPGMPGFHDHDLYPLGGPDLATAQALATASGQVPATAVMYVQDTPAGQDWAQIVKTDLAAIGIDVQLQVISQPSFFPRLATPGEPFDLAAVGWGADYADPFDFIDNLLHGKNVPGAGGGDSNLSRFDDPAFNQRMDDASPLQPPARYDAYSALDRDIMADAAPWAAWGNPNARDFFSARIGCQAFNPLFGMDLAALCVR